MNLQKRKAKMANARRSDFGEEFVERLRKDRFRKAYILVNGMSSGDEEEDEEELCFEDEDDEIASYALEPARHPPSVHSSRRPPSVAHSQCPGGAFGFDARDLYFFGVLSELTDKFTPERIARLIAKSPPPADFRSLVSIERVAYLLYFSLYGRYLSVGKFHNVFNREFFKYTSAGDSERVAFLKICRITFEEYKRREIELNKRAYKLSQKHLFSDGRATPDSRLSDRPSIKSEDITSLDSLAKELMFYRSPHTPVRFGRGGKIIYVDPARSVSTVCVEDLKRFYKDVEGRRYVEILETFKGPLLVGHTPSQTPLLFIQCQINRLLQSDVYRANPSSGDANDCLLIWSLLEMLIRQQGKVTGPDLARLLCSNQQNHLAALHKSFLKKDADLGRSASAIFRQDSADAESATAISASSAMDRVTQFLLGGHIDEAIDSAIGDGLLFDALFLAHRLFRNDRDRLEAIEARLMAYRSPQHPITTLLSVAASQPVPLLTNPTSYETNGWRSHISIVLANLQSPTAMDAVYQLGLALAAKDFNSAADFCFLAVSLLWGVDCFSELEREGNQRRSIRLISATLPDDEANSFNSRFGWSILDYQATELFDFALQLANPNSVTLLSKSDYYAKARLQYSQLLDELGGFKNAVELYRLGGQPNAANNDVALSNKTSSNEFQPEQNSSFAQYFHQKSPKGSKTSVPSQRESFAQQLKMSKEMAEGRKKELDGTETRKSTAPTAIKDEKPNQRPPPNSTINVPTVVEPINIMPAVAESPKIVPIVSEAPKIVPIVAEPPKIMSTVAEPPKKLPTVAEPPKFVPTTAEPQKTVTTAEPLNFSSPSLDGFPLPQMPFPAAPSMQTSAPKETEPVKTTTNRNLDDKNESGGGGGKGFLRGFFSKIKAPLDSNEMKLPKDNNPKIVWDSQLGRYVDQEQDEQPQEELAPPPVIPTYQSQQWQQAVQPLEQQQLPAAPASNRPFQGKSRYANAWNS